MDSGIKWVIALIVIYTLWYVINKRDESAATWLVILILLSAYTYNRHAVNRDLSAMGLLKNT